jgi:hypothetical protein
MPHIQCKLVLVDNLLLKVVPQSLTHKLQQVVVWVVNRPLDLVVVVVLVVVLVVVVL